MGISRLPIQVCMLQGVVYFEDRPSGTPKFFLWAIFLPVVEVRGGGGK